ncbi:MAG: F0F1 ATP synthase subunit delta [Gammaproteobacteria bacterium]|nr:F0F1 ATP synthase subunit delta [Gammaproteobacteria bacterium]
MAETSTIARPYALAAFKQARQEGKLAEWSDMIALLARIVEDRQMKGVLASPKVKRDQLADLIIDICGDKLSATGANFVRVLAEKGRLSYLPEISKIYEKERAESEGRSQVEVRSAFELDDAQKSHISDAMSKRLGTDVSLSVEVDKSLIGGVVIRAGDLVIDASLRGRMNRLSNSLL